MLPPVAALLALAAPAAARHYLLHPQGQTDFCLALDMCAAEAAGEYPLITERCSDKPHQKWATRLIGDTETITWYTLADPDACMNANTTSDPPQTAQQVVTAACTPAAYNPWQDFTRDGNQLIVGSLDETLWALDRRDGAVPGPVQLWPWVEWNRNQVWDFDLYE